MIDPMALALTCGKAHDEGLTTINAVAATEGSVMNTNRGVVASPARVKRRACDALILPFAPLRAGCKRAPCVGVRSMTGGNQMSTGREQRRAQGGAHV
jgi:hypothetical protein